MLNRHQRRAAAKQAPKLNPEALQAMSGFQEAAGLVSGQLSKLEGILRAVQAQQQANHLVQLKVMAELTGKPVSEVAALAERYS